MTADALNDTGFTADYQTPIQIAPAALLANDTPAESISVTSVDSMTTNGGSIGFDWSTGNYVYTPPSGFSGTDHFSYSIEDWADGTTDSASVSVSVSADTMQANDDSFTTAEDQDGWPSLSENDDLPYGTWWLELVSGPSHGTLDGWHYTPDPDYHGTDGFSYRLTDGTRTSEANVSITVTSVFDAPRVAPDAADPMLPAVYEDAGPSDSVLVADLIDPTTYPDYVTDVEGTDLGVAIVGKSGDGVWQYNTGGSWHDVAAVSNTSALLLYADGSTALRFVPDSDASGAASLTFRAWNRRGTATNGSTGINVSVNGGSTNYSAATDTFGLNINGVNDAPVLAGSSSPELDAIAEDDVDSAGTLVSSLISAAGYVTDVDTGALKGIAVTGADVTNGTWQYSLDGTTWNDFPSVGTTSALLLASDESTRIRFRPGADFYSTAGIEFKAWDQTTGDNGSTADVSIAGGTSAFSVDGGTASITVNEVDDPGTFTPGFNVTVDEDNGAYSAGWATDLSPGPANESGQSISFNVSNDNNGLFSVQPAIDPDGVLTFTPVADANGSATVTVSMGDSGGATTGEVTFTITLNPVNDAPVLNGTSSPALDPISEDDVDNGGTLVSSLTSASGYGSDIDGPGSGIGVTGADSTNGTWQYSLDGTTWSDFPSVGSNSALLLASDANTRIRFRPGTDFHSTASIDFKLWDRSGGENGGTADASTGGGGSPFSAGGDSATITVNEVNDPGTFTAGADVTVDEDSGAYSAGWASDLSPGPADESGQTVWLNVSDDNASLFAEGGRPSIDASGNLTFTPAANANGFANVSVSISDSGGATSSAVTFKITVRPTNDAPELSETSLNPTIDEDGNYTTPAASDIDGDALEVVVVSGSGPSHGTITDNGNGTLTYTPGADRTDGTGFQYYVRDGHGGESAVASVTVSITPVNDAPWAHDESTEVSVTHNQTDPVALEGVSSAAYGDVDDGTLTVSYGTTMPLMVDPGTTGSTTYTVSDPSWASASASVSLKVNIIPNRAPAAAGGTFTVLEDGSVTIGGGDLATDEDGDTLGVSLGEGAGASHGTVVDNGDGTVTYTPDANSVADDSFDVVVSDGWGGTLTTTVHIGVTPVNDAPDFSIEGSGPSSSAMDAGAVSIAGFAHDITPGAANEGAQTLSFVLENDNPDLFTTSGQPAISADGTLTYTAQFAGMATVRVKLHDNGGTEHGGADTSAEKTFTIHVTEPAAPDTSGSGGGGGGGGGGDIGGGVSVTPPPVELMRNWLLDAKISTSAGDFHIYDPVPPKMEAEDNVHLEFAVVPSDTPGRTIYIDWGDGAHDEVAVAGNFAEANHSYSYSDPNSDLFKSFAGIAVTYRSPSGFLGTEAIPVSIAYTPPEIVVISAPPSTGLSEGDTALSEGDTATIKVRVEHAPQANTIEVTAAGWVFAYDAANDTYNGSRVMDESGDINVRLVATDGRTSTAKVVSFNVDDVAWSTDKYDPGHDDVYQTTIEWGDGATDVFVGDLGVLNSTNPTVRDFPLLTHVYSAGTGTLTETMTIRQIGIPTPVDVYSRSQPVTLNYKAPEVWYEALDANTNRYWVANIPGGDAVMARTGGGDLPRFVTLTSSDWQKQLHPDLIGYVDIPASSGFPSDYGDLYFYDSHLGSSDPSPISGAAPGLGLINREVYATTIGYEYYRTLGRDMKAGEPIAGSSRQDYAHIVIPRTNYAELANPAVSSKLKLRYYVISEADASQITQSTTSQDLSRWASNASADWEKTEDDIVFDAHSNYIDLILKPKDDSEVEPVEKFVVIITHDAVDDGGWPVTFNEYPGLEGVSDAGFSYVGTVDLFDADRYVEFGSNNVDTQSSGLTREEVDVDGANVDLYDGVKSWDPPLGGGFIPTLYSGIRDTIANSVKRPAGDTAAGGAAVDTDAAYQEFVYDWSGYDGTTPTFRMSGGIGDLASERSGDNGQFYPDLLDVLNPNPSLDGWRAAYVHRLIPVGYDGEDFGFLLLRRDGTSAWFKTSSSSLTAGSPNVATPELVYLDSQPESAAARGDGLYDDDQLSAAHWTFTGLDPDRMYQVTMPVGTKATDLRDFYSLNDGRMPGLPEVTLGTALLGPRTVGVEVDNQAPISLGWFKPDADGNLEFRAERQFYLPYIGDLTIADDWTFKTPDGSLSTLTTVSEDADPTDDFDIQFKLTFPDGTIQKFDGLGLLRASIDRNGNQTTYEYDADGRDFDLDNRLTKVVLPDGQSVSLVYYGDKRVASVVDSTGNVTKVIGGEMFSTQPWANPTGASTQSVQQRFVIGGNAVRPTTDPNEGPTPGLASVEQALKPYVGDSFPGQQEKTWNQTASDTLAPTGEIGRFESNGGSGEARATYTRATYAGESTPQKYEYQFDRFGLLTALAKPKADTSDPNAEEDVWFWQRDPKTGLLTKSKTPAGRGYTDGAGSVDPSTDGYDSAVYEYEQEEGKNTSRLKKITYDDGTSEQWTYGAFNQIASYQDRLGNTTSYTLDEKGRVTKITKPGPDDTTYTYAEYTYTESSDDVPAGLVKTMTDARGFITTYDYYTTLESLWTGLVKKITYDYGRDETFELFFYDDHRHLTLKRDTEGVVHGYRFDYLGQLIEERTGLTADPHTGAFVGGEIVTTNTYDAGGDLRSTSAPAANQPAFLPAPLLTTATYSYDALGRRTKEQLPTVAGAGQQSGTPIDHISYTADGLVSKTTGVNGVETEYFYDERRQLVKQIVRSGANGLVDRGTGAALSGIVETVTTYQYDIEGNLAATTDEFGRTAYTTVNRDGEVVRTETPDPDGGGGSLGAYVTLTEYNADGQVTKVTTPNPAGSGTVDTNYTYRPDGLLRREEGPLGQYTEYDYYGDGMLKSKETGLGSVEYSKVEYVYDALGRTTSTQTTFAGGFTSINTSTTYTFDAEGLLEVTNTDERGGVTTTHYNALGQVAKVEYPLPGVNDKNGNPLPRPVTTYEYDADGSLRREVHTYAGGESDPNNQIITYAYDVLGRMRTKTVNGEVTNYSYDLAGRLVEERASDGTYVKHVYNDRGDEIGTQTYGSRLASGLPGLPLTYTENLYDEFGNLMRSTVDGREQTTYAYDALDRETGSQTDYLDDAKPALPPEVITYNQAGLVATSSDGAEKTAYVYDALGRTISSTQTDVDVNSTTPAKTITTTYDDANREESTLDADQNNTVVTVDGLGHVLSKKLYSNGVPQTGSGSYTYDVSGNVLTKTDLLGRITSYSYDELGRLKSETWLGDPDGYVVNYSYDKLGRLERVTDPNVTYTYDYDGQGRVWHTTVSGLTSGDILLTHTFGANDRLLDTSDSLGGATTYFYDSAGRLSSATLYDGSSVNPVGTIGYHYDPLNRVDNIDRQSGATTVRTSLGYDPQGRLGDIASSVVGGSSIFAGTFHYEYDEQNRLKEYVGPEGARSYQYDGRGQLEKVFDDDNTELENYSYDAEGNREAANSDAIGSVTYTPGVLNQIQEDQNYSYEYDAEGNRTAKVTKATGEREVYSYDFRDRLSGVTFKNSSGAVTGYYQYVYDAANHRIAKKEYDASDTKVGEEQYVYDGDTLLLVLNGDGTLKTRQFVVGGGVVGQERAGQSLEWLLADERGSTRALVAANGTVRASYSFDAYGNLAAGSDDLTLVYSGWTGLMYDAETGNDYAWNRYYDPRLGEWLNNDPIGFDGGTTNLGEYVGNGPTNGVDPTGLAQKLSNQWQWHHLIPQAVMDTFVPNVDYHQAKFGFLLPAGAHIGEMGIHPEWDEEWKKWLIDRRNNGEEVTEAMLLKQSHKMINDPKYQFDHHLSHGVQAPEGLDYHTWQDIAKREEFLNKHKELTKEMLHKQKEWIKSGVPVKSLRGAVKALSILAAVVSLLENADSADAAALHYNGIAENLARGNLEAADHHAKFLNDALPDVQKRIWWGLWTKAYDDLKDSDEIKQLRSQVSPAEYSWQLYSSRRPVQALPDGEVVRFQLDPQSKEIFYAVQQDSEGTYYTYPRTAGSGWDGGNMAPHRWDDSQGKLITIDWIEWQHKLGFPVNQRSGIFGWIPW